MGQRYRLDAKAVFAWLEITGRQNQAQELWLQVRLIAAGALDYWREYA